MTGLGFLGTGKDSTAYAISADGSTVVGQSHNSSGNYEAYRWNNGTMTGLGFLAGGDYNYASAVSADGSTVAGSSKFDSSNNVQAYRWKNGIITGLGFLGTRTNSNVKGMSADGNTIVGIADDDTGFEGFRWTSATGMQSISQWLAAAGVVAPAILAIKSGATTVSADGNVITGLRYNRNGTATFWLARVGPDGKGFFSDVKSYDSGTTQTAPDLPTLSK